MRQIATRSLAAAALMLSLHGCENDPPKPEPVAAPKPAPHAKVEFITAAAGEDATVIVKREAERAKRDGRPLLIYVGAVWCEPCQYFHKAAEAGQLDSVFPGLRLVEFDRDRDEARLGRAGCLSPLIPLFAKPDAEGRCSSERIEGSIKGPGAVDEITPRLARLVK